MKNMIRLIIAAVSVISVLCFGTAISAQAEEYYFYDYAGLVTDDEYYEIESELARISDEYGFDTVIYTAESLGGDTADDYVRNVTDQLVKNQDGIMFLICPEDRDYSFYAFGEVDKHVITPVILDDLADDVISYVRDGKDDYYSAFKRFAARSEEEYIYVIENGNRSKFTAKHILIAVSVGLLIALITVGIMSSSMKTIRSQTSADRYSANGGLKLRVSRDIFLYTSVTRTKIESSSSSSSGGGHSGSTSSGKY